jgi:hypothetical protein
MEWNDSLCATPSLEKEGGKAEATAAVAHVAVLADLLVGIIGLVCFQQVVWLGTEVAVEMNLLGSERISCSEVVRI